MSIIKILRSN